MRLKSANTNHWSQTRFARSFIGIFYMLEALIYFFSYEGDSHNDTLVTIQDAY
jgi:hypothetical protein